MRLPVLARVAVASSLISLFATQPAWAWGIDGHSIINRAAAASLPSDVPLFLRDASALDTIEYLGPEPDRWRNRAESELSAEQAPDHFIDLEYADLVGPLPKKRYDFIRALNAMKTPPAGVTLTPEKVGMQPWEVEEIWQKLKVDLRDYRELAAAHKPTHAIELAIVYDAGWLGHYVGDGSMPLHTTIQYNGWTGPNPNGYTVEHKIHSQFESTYVHNAIKYADVSKLVADTKPTPIDDEWAQYLAYLHKTNTFVEKTYQLEKAGAFTDAGTPEGKAFAAERLAAGAIELRDLIYSAWIHSADPVEEYHGN
ncbi:phospholipase C/P1 nuclease family protein [Granulicella paludicola]|uniref:nuclease n=1 Tax=Granulicella paludicola TaxID=474951 RepID=UPI0021E06F8C|nr:nuclease [Granulicella paludicola]